jgi:predicted anti-sigma-YlaC factor YlaD
MTCRDAISVLADYLDTILDAGVLADLEAHLRDCAPCRAYLDTYRRTRDLVGASERAEMPDELKTRLRSFLLERLRRPDR